MSRSCYKCVPFAGTNDRDRDSRAHKENGTLSRPVFPSRFVPLVSRLSVPLGVDVGLRRWGLPWPCGGAR